MINAEFNHVTLANPTEFEIKIKSWSHLHGKKIKNSLNSHVIRNSSLKTTKYGSPSSDTKQEETDTYDPLMQSQKN